MNTWKICKKILFIFCFFFLFLYGSQKDSTQTYIIPFGFIESFYCYDWNQPENSTRLPFLYSYNRHNEWNLNLALIGVEVKGEQYHALVAFQTGTYPEDNYALERTIYRLINQAYVGISLDARRKWWLDVGVMNSHLWFEAPISLEQPTLTRSLLAENSPYFLTGARLTYSHKGHLFGLWLTNGWQRIERVQGNSLPGIGTQWSWNNQAKTISLNWNTFLCSEYPDSVRKYRVYNDIYLIYTPSDRWQFYLGYDIGLEQKEKGSNVYYPWQGGAMIVRHRLNPKMAIAVRTEALMDWKTILYPLNQGYKLAVTGYSVNLDYQIAPNVFWRVEPRLFYNLEPYFQRGNELVQHNFSVTSSIAARF